MSGFFARRLALGCLLPAALTPRAEWHERWKHVNAAAGAIAAQAISAKDPISEAARIADAVDDEFIVACSLLEESDAAKCALIWPQRKELIDGLCKRIGERLLLLQCEDLQAIEAALALIAQRRKT